MQKYFHFYNTERPHQTFNSATPLEVYQQSIGEMKKETKKAEPLKACAIADDSDYNEQIEKQSILNY